MNDLTAQISLRECKICINHGLRVVSNDYKFFVAFQNVYLFYSLVQQLNMEI